MGKIISRLGVPAVGLVLRSAYNTSLIGGSTTRITRCARILEWINVFVQLLDESMKRRRVLQSIPQLSSDNIEFPSTPCPTFHYQG